MAKTCPKCGLTTPAEAQRCNCGYHFVTNDPAQYQSASQRQYKGVRGWLLLLCVGLTIFNPIDTVQFIAFNFSANYPHFDQFPNLRVLTYLDMVLALGVMALGVYAGVALWRVRPRAVQTAKNYYLCFLAYTVIAAIFPVMSGLPSEEISALLKGNVKIVVRMAVYVAICSLYLHRSKRVKATYTLQDSESGTRLG